jgi:hypothetical protein
VVYPGSLFAGLTIAPLAAVISFIIFFIGWRFIPERSPYEDLPEEDTVKLHPSDDDTS